MLAKAFSFGLSGLDAYEVTIEVDVARGLPAMSIVGLPDNAIRESKERVRAAIRNCGFDFPSARITVNLAPADTKKEGPSFDLAIALAVLTTQQKIPAGTLARYAVLGELSLSGRIKPVAGVLAATLTAAHMAHNIDGIIVPHANAEEAALAGTVPVFSFQNMDEAVLFLNTPSWQQPFRPSVDNKSEPTTKEFDMSDVKGQTFAKRGLEVAAAGGHNVLLIGPPGSGKTMLARRFPSILPGMSREEALEITKIHSAAGTMRPISGLISERPFRSPHHTASHIALVGGGSDPRPGEVTLAHHGILFLDELPEFSRGALEALRQPLEDGCVTVARASRTLRFPAQFTLLGAMNPCQCGLQGQSKTRCKCSNAQIQKYRSKISSPLLDRIDIHLDVPAVNYYELTNRAYTETSAHIKERVNKALAVQQKRFLNENKLYNARMNHQEVQQFCSLGKNERELLRQAMAELNLSVRAYDKILKISRTIADLAGTEKIKTEHLAEAIQYRSLDRTFFG